MGLLGVGYRQLFKKKKILSKDIFKSENVGFNIRSDHRKEKMILK